MRKYKFSLIQGALVLSVFLFSFLFPSTPAPAVECCEYYDVDSQSLLVAWVCILGDGTPYGCIGTCVSRVNLYNCHDLPCDGMDSYMLLQHWGECESDDINCDDDTGWCHYDKRPSYLKCSSICEGGF